MKEFLMHVDKDELFFDHKLSVGTIKGRVIHKTFRIHLTKDLVRNNTPFEKGK